MRSMLLDDSERKQADTLGLMDSLHEIGGSEFLPLGGEFGLRNGGYHQCDENKNKAYSGQTVSWHEASGIMKQAILSENTPSEQQVRRSRGRVLISRVLTLLV